MHCISRPNDGILSLFLVFIEHRFTSYLDKKLASQLMSAVNGTTKSKDKAYFVFAFDPALNFY